MWKVRRALYDYGYAGMGSPGGARWETRVEGKEGRKRRRKWEMCGGREKKMNHGYAIAIDRA
jgi:hypothetical protein